MSIKCVELLVLLSLCSLAVPEPLSNDLNDLITAIKRLIDYYEVAYRDMNFDAIFGLRVLEGEPFQLPPHSKVEKISLHFTYQVVLNFKYQTMPKEKLNYQSKT